MCFEILCCTTQTGIKLCCYITCNCITIWKNFLFDNNEYNPVHYDHYGEIV